MEVKPLRPATSDAHVFWLDLTVWNMNDCRKSGRLWIRIPSFRIYIFVGCHFPDQVEGKLHDRTYLNDLFRIEAAPKRRTSDCNLRWVDGWHFLLLLDYFRLAQQESQGPLRGHREKRETHWRAKAHLDFVPRRSPDPEPDCGGRGQDHVQQQRVRCADRQSQTQGKRTWRPQSLLLEVGNRRLRLCWVDFGEAFGQPPAPARRQWNSPAAESHHLVQGVQLSWKNARREQRSDSTENILASSRWKLTGGTQADLCMFSSTQPIL